MSNANRTACCARPKWAGRAHCDLCPMRDSMLFSGLPEMALTDSPRAVDQFVFPPGAVLHEMGRDGEYVYSIRRGLVKLLHAVPGGGSRIVRLLGTGASVGLELLDGEKGYRHTVIAVSEVHACRIPVRMIRHIINDHAQLWDQVRRRLQDQLDCADRWIIALSTGTAKQRVVQLLLVLGDISGDSNGDIELLPRDDMAAIVGTSVETVSRIIAELKRRRLLFKVSQTLYRFERDALLAIISPAAD